MKHQRVKIYTFKTVCAKIIFNKKKPFHFEDELTSD